MRQLSKVLFAAGLLAVSVSVYADVEVYKIDNAHSFANFNIRHVASKLSGTFSDVTGNININRANLSNSSVDAKISLLKCIGYANDPWGGYRTGIEAHTNLKASDFGFTWGKAGSPVGDEIEVTLLIEGVKTN